MFSLQLFIAVSVLLSFSDVEGRSLHEANVGGQSQAERHRVSAKVAKLNEELWADNSFNGVHFPRTLEYEVEVDGQKQLLHLIRDKAVNMNVPYQVVIGNKTITTWSKRMKKTAYYYDLEYGASVACTARVGRTGNMECDVRAIIQLPDEECYYHSDDDTDCKKRSEEAGSFRNDIRDIPKAAGRDRKDRHSERQKRQATGEFTFEDDRHYVELFFNVDWYFTRYFLLKNENDVSAAVEETREFLGLLCNSMNWPFAYIEANSPRDLKLVFHFAGARIAQTKSSNPDWSYYGEYGEKHLDVDSVLGYVRDSKKPAVLDNPEFVDPQLDVDLVMFITGLNTADVTFAYFYYFNNYYEADPNVLGVAYVGAVCDNRRIAFTLTEQGSFLATTIIHEAAHSLGALHDPDNTYYLMTPSIFKQTIATKDTFRVFSNKSIVEMMDHLDGTDCLSRENTHFTPDRFTANQCAGYIGQRYSIDDQCRLAARTDDDEPDLDSYACLSQTPTEEICYKLTRCFHTTENCNSNDYLVQADDYTECGENMRNDNNNTNNYNYNAYNNNYHANDNNNNPNDNNYHANDDNYNANNNNYHANDNNYNANDNNYHANDNNDNSNDNNYNANDNNYNANENNYNANNNNYQANDNNYQANDNNYQANDNNYNTNDNNYNANNNNYNANDNNHNANDNNYDSNNDNNSSSNNNSMRMRWIYILCLPL